MNMGILLEESSRWPVVPPPQADSRGGRLVIPLGAGQAGRRRRRSIVLPAHDTPE